MTASDYLAIAGLLATIVAVPSGMMIATLKRIESGQAQFRADLGKLESRISVCEREKLDSVAYASETQSQRSSIDRMSNRLSELVGRIDASLGMEAIGKQLVKALEKRA